MEGESINLEVDLMAKYAESLLKHRSDGFSLSKKYEKESSNISKDWLENNGFS